MRIFIAGPMTGLPDHNIPAFEAAAKRLRDKGRFVINPVELSKCFGTAEEIEESCLYLCHGFRDSSCAKLATSIVDAGLAALRGCDAIYLLKGWEQSCGAKKELAEAVKHGLTVMLDGEE